MKTAVARPASTVPTAGGASAGHMRCFRVRSEAPTNWLICHLRRTGESISHCRLCAELWFRTRVRRIRAVALHGSASEITNHQPGGNLAPRAESQFGEDAADVRFDRALADDESFGDRAHPCRTAIRPQ